MSRASKILSKLNESNNKFKSGDFVYYISEHGSDYNCFARVLDYTLNDKVLIEILLKLDGRQEIDDVVENGNTKEVFEYSLKPGKEMLDKKVETTKMKLARLEQLQKEI